ncbi:unnamed protein product [Macrosiphum euphorbiae]|uniref:Uncharacterized protein n=1 Tax=Macrosiphum euphorbiae TaxID=13131 RepID=A0AAV0XJ28_9HEMI|nr:unnamed protein product [Macrosiphum euphorbiae]
MSSPSSPSSSSSPTRSYRGDAATAAAVTRSNRRRSLTVAAGAASAATAMESPTISSPPASADGPRRRGSSAAGGTVFKFGALGISGSASVSAMCDAANGPASASAVVGGSGSAGAQAGKLPRTLSTSVLRIKHRSSFWDKFWEQRSKRDL